MTQNEKRRWLRIEKTKQDHKSEDTLHRVNWNKRIVSETKIGHSPRILEQLSLAHGRPKFKRPQRRPFFV